MTNFRNKNETIAAWIDRFLNPIPKMLCNPGYEAGRCRTIMFSGSTIYSYGSHYEIAKLFNRNGNVFALFNNHHYSATTAQHRAAVFRALRNAGIPLYTVNPLELAYKGECAYVLSPDSALLWASYKERAQEWAGRARRARKPLRKRFYVEYAESIANEAAECADAFGFNWPDEHEPRYRATGVQ